MELALLADGASDFVPFSVAGWHLLGFSLP